MITKTTKTTYKLKNCFASGTEIRDEYMNRIYLLEEIGALFSNGKKFDIVVTSTDSEDIDVEEVMSDHYKKKTTSEDDIE